MNINLNEVKKDIEPYFKDHLSKYTVLEIRRKSNHLDDYFSGWYQRKNLMGLMPYGVHGTD